MYVSNRFAALGTAVFAGAMAATALVGTANASTVYDGALASPGVHYGTGNTNAGFTVSTLGGIELALGVVNRFLGPVHPSPTTGSVYEVSPGTSGGLALWDFVFSVNTGSTPITSVTPTLTILNVGTSLSLSGNPLLIPDNSVSGNSAQNAENLSFGFLGGLGFNPLAPGTYIITLSLDSNSVSETINATPLPSTWLMLLSGFVGLGFFAYRGSKKRTAIATA